MKIVINPEFQRLIPPLHATELEQLEANIIADGCRDPITLWGTTIVDGHNRFDICTRRNIRFETRPVELENENEAKNWIILNQLGRRNLSPDAASQLRGRLNLSRRKEVTNPEGLGGKSRKIDEAQSELHQTEDTASQVARETGVSRATVIRDTAFVRATDKLGISSDVIAGKVDAPRAAIIEVAKALPPNPTPAEVDEAKAKIPHVANNSGDNEWYTPPEFIDAARATLGGIDLDPASSALANQAVGARRFFAKDDDGLSLPWRGRVWLNPPYSNPLCAQFCERVTTAFEKKEIKAAIVLVNNATETRWFQRMLEAASAVCFPLGRIQYLKPDGARNSPLQGQAFLYFGDDKETFKGQFKTFGIVMFLP